MLAHPRNIVISCLLAAALLCPMVGLAQSAATPDPSDLSARRTAIKRLYDDGHLVDAEKQGRALLADAERIYGPDSIQTAQALDILVPVLSDNQGKLPETMDLAQRAIALKQKVLPADDPELATSLMNLGSLYRLRAQYSDARRSFERALQIRESHLGPEDPLVADVLMNLGTLYGMAADYGRAREAFQRSLAIREKALGQDDRSLVTPLGNLAETAEYTGDYAVARECQERALSISQKTFGPEHPRTALAMDDLAELMGLTGDYAQARLLYEKAIPILEKTFGNEHGMVADALDGYGEMLVAAGDYEAARPIYERSFAIWQKVRAPDHPNIAFAMEQIGTLREHDGKYEEARDLYARALVIWQKRKGPNHPAVARTLMHLGDVSAALGENTTARTDYQQALEIRMKALGADHPEIAETESALAAVLLANKAGSDALPMALDAERISRRHLRLTMRALSEREALAYAAARPSGLNAALSIAAERPGDPEVVRQVWDSLIQSRAIVLDGMATRHRAADDSSDPAVALLAARLKEVRARLGRLEARGPSGSSPAAYRDLLQHTRDEEEQAERELSMKSASFGDEQRRDRLGLREVAAGLPPRSALISFATYKDLQQGPRPAASSYIALVLRSGSSRPVAVPLGTARRIDAAVKGWRDEMMRPAESPWGSSMLEREYRQAAAELRREVWDPLRSALGGSQQVFIVPDSSLHLVNFSAFSIANGKYLIESGPGIHYLSAERDLVPASSARQGEGLLAMGAPAFDDGVVFASMTRPHADGVHSGFRGSMVDCRAFRDLRFAPLPASGGEVGDIAALWASHGRSLHRAALRSASSSRVLQLTGAAADEETFKNEAPGKRVLHLATHAFVVPQECFGPAAENPLRLAGLAFAGANRRSAAATDADDEILTAEEISALNLEGVDWAVLSACDTGLGAIRAGEGVLGLQRAFQVAGARTVIMSLSQVEDTAAREWMRALYTHRIRDRMSTINSVRRASLDLLGERRRRHLSSHPFYWASFVATGDWR